MRPTSFSPCLLVAGLALAGCAKGHEAGTCVSASDCARGEVCLDSSCVPDGADAGNGDRDAGASVDAGARDAAGGDGGGGDGGWDGGIPDAGFDAGPSCTNGIHDVDEADVDCGGSCPACDECGACAADADCARGRCSPEGLCAIRQELYVDWVSHCSSDGSAALEVPGLPAGDYEVTALDSGATVWDPPWSPPDNGWFYRVPCAGLTVPGVSTPSSTYYADAATAFANVTSTSGVTGFAGGTLRCEVRDSNCADNHGGIRFALERSCP